VSKYTPGPLDFRSLPSHNSDDEDGPWMYGLFNGGDNYAEHEANAHLIAAAPELLEALEALLEADVYADVEGLCYIKHSDTEDGETAVKNAIAAIAKAKGEQQ